MKVGLYWENGFFQAVLTPENEHEKKVCDLISKNNLIRIERGGFYHCMGGWVRRSADEQESVMLILEETKEAK